MMPNEIQLSVREKQILQLIYEGYTDGKIAGKLNISSNTVRTHREHLRKKFCVSNTTSMLRMAVELNLIITNIKS